MHTIILYFKQNKTTIIQILRITSIFIIPTIWSTITTNKTFWYAFWDLTTADLIGMAVVIILITIFIPQK